jgi:hypothetical protein
VLSPGQGPGQGSGTLFANCSLYFLNQILYPYAPNFDIIHTYKNKEVIKMTTKNKRCIIPIIIVLFMIFSGPFLSVWGPTGHRIIAEIAERHLTDEAKQAVKNILGTKPLARFSTCS